ncbi:hypothetical protein [Allorhodopirellula heiligendammensis]|uniref:SWIM-type domain-containing protein n=1 Tax=Allorhodopirellula heiligendammensis TaxID=2714739 RepID=A0A5C6BDD0_9BACT|nr:hypothetical protein [Allorhodopirellula heiligendammensis]TWU10225.1 hypothetical protein Poly21_51950 [Allorhodopirellula heiligendammensis]
MSWYGGFAPYVPVAQRLARGNKAAAKRIKKGQSLQPLNISGTRIATTFWGKSWCTHLEKYSDYSNRLPRGRTYARNGSVADLRITRGQITAMVCGSSLYDITIKITPLADTDWKAICRDCSASIHSLIDLMRGKLGDDVIRRMTDPKRGMFPAGNEIEMNCNCPDGASLCKHLAAALYGVGNRLDTAPELLFLLRGVDQNELISQAMVAENATSAMGLDSDSELAGEDLGAMFGIELASPAQTPIAAKKSRKMVKKKVAKKVAKKAVKKKTDVRKKPKAKAVKKKPTKRKQAAPATAKVKSVKKRVSKPTNKKSTKKRIDSNRTVNKRKVVKKKSAAKKATKSADTRGIVIRLN